MSDTPKPPRTYQAFRTRFPKIANAWDLLRDEEAGGPFDEKTLRLLKLAVAIGGQREGAVHSGVRKARAAGASDEEIEHLLALAASTLGLPPTVMVYSWVREQLEGGKR